MLTAVEKYLLIPSTILLLITSGCNRNKLLVEVMPSTANVETGQSRQFTAKIKPPNAVVIWSVDEGDAWGTISESGLYTAPALIPSPSIATVRATLIADSTVSDTAQVTIVSDIDTTTTSTIPGNTTTTTTIDGQLPDEPTIYLRIFNIGFDSAGLGSDVTELAIEAVFKASELNGGYLTLAGTLTASGNTFNYAPQPADRLIVVLSNGEQYEFTFNKFDGYLNGTAQDFFYSHDIDFTAKSGTQLDLHIVSYCPYQNGQSNLQRNTIGTAIYYNEQRNMNITQTGTLKHEIDVGWLYMNYETQCTGSVSTTYATFNINEYYYSEYVHNSDTAVAVWNRARKSNSGAAVNGTTYQYQDAYVHWISSSSLYGNNEPNSQWYGVVEDAHQWAASGGVLKNGQVAGQTQFDRAVVNGTYGPYFILNLTSNSTIVLHKLLNLQ